MNWLNEIENEATLALESDEAFTEGYMDDLRMARVIRELATGHNLESYAEYEAWRENVSPDTKEVINDLAESN